MILGKSLNMAQRIETYQRRLRGIRIPRIDFAEQQEQAAGYRQLQVAMDKMTTFAINAANNIAKVEGVEYGMENAPNMKQLEDAYNLPKGTKEEKEIRSKAIKQATSEMGKELAGIGDSFSTFGTKAKNAALDQTYLDLTTLAKKKILEIKARADKNPMLPQNQPDVIKTELENIVSGFAGVFDEEDGAYARKFRAEMGLHTYSELHSITVKHNAEFLEMQKAAFATSWDADKELAETFFTMGNPYKIVDGNLVLAPEDEREQNKTDNPTTKKITDTLIANKKALAINYRMSESYISKMDDEWKEAILTGAKSVVIKNILSSSSTAQGQAVQRNAISTAITEVLKGTYTKQNSAFSKMSKEVQNVLLYYRKDGTRLEEVRNFMVDSVIKSGTAETNAMNVYTKAKTNVVEVNSAGIIDVILNKEMDSTEKTSKIRSLITEIYKVDREAGAKALQEMEDIVGPTFDLQGDETFENIKLESDGATKSLLDADLINEPGFVTTTYSKLLGYFKDGKLTYKDLQFYYEKLRAKGDKESQEILTAVRATLKMPANLLINAQSVSRANLQTYGRIESALITAKKSKDFSAEKFKNDVVDKILKEASVDALDKLANRLTNQGFANFEMFKRTVQTEINATSTSQERKKFLREMLAELIAIQGDAAQKTKFNNILPNFFE